MKKISLQAEVLSYTIFSLIIVSVASFFIFLKILFQKE